MLLAAASGNGDMMEDDGVLACSSSKTFYILFKQLTCAAPARCVMQQDVTYYVQTKAGRGQKLTILDGLQGFFEPGKMTAVVSYSGDRNSIHSTVYGAAQPGVHRGKEGTGWMGGGCGSLLAAGFYACSSCGSCCH